MHTTLNQIKQHNPCSEGWEKLLKYLNKTEADDDPLHLSVILESNGINDAIWALRSVDGKEKEIRLMAADFAETSLPIYEKYHPDDQRPRLTIKAARDYVNGLITKNDLAAASAAARDAAWAAARDAARDAAREKITEIFKKYITQWN